MKTEWKYHITCSFEELDGTKCAIFTQLYDKTVGLVISSKHSFQLSLPPREVEKLEQDFINLQKEGKIKNLVFNQPITVVKINGKFKKKTLNLQTCDTL